MGYDDATERKNVCTKWHQVGHGVYRPNVIDNPKAQGGEQIVNYPEHKEKGMPAEKMGRKNDFACSSMNYILLH